MQPNIPLVALIFSKEPLSYIMLICCQIYEYMSMTDNGRAIRHTFLHDSCTYKCNPYSNPRYENSGGKDVSFIVRAY